MSISQQLQAFLELNQQKLIKIVYTYSLMEQEVAELRKEVKALKEQAAKEKQPSIMFSNILDGKE